MYGVTSAYGDRAAVRLDAEARARQAVHAATVAAAVSGRLVAAVGGLLADAPLPSVPARGHGEAGEIMALAHLFGPLILSIDPGPKEGLALINGSPCAADEPRN